jgi:hypothetical protein
MLEHIWLCSSVEYSRFANSRGKGAVRCCFTGICHFPAPCELLVPRGVKQPTSTS